MVSLGFTARAKEPTLRAGYVVENPIWKDRYRCDSTRKSKPSCKGWSIVVDNSDEGLGGDVRIGPHLRPANLFR